MKYMEHMGEDNWQTIWQAEIELSWAVRVAEGPLISKSRA